MKKNEFGLIDTYFKAIVQQRDDVVFGIGDDAACLRVPAGKELLVSCDTLVAGVHFLKEWHPYDIAYRAVMVNVSDMAAMGATPSWVTLALTLPELDTAWLEQFSKGLQVALGRFNIALVGGDTTRGPLSITLTIHGFVSAGCAIRRNGAQVGDKIYLSGFLGAAALAVEFLSHPEINHEERAVLMEKLLHPEPRIDLNHALQKFATAAIDISDGLSADLHHICSASQVGACLTLAHIPVHPLVKKYQGANAIHFALNGGDDYELCFTTSPHQELPLRALLEQHGLTCYPIGVIDAGNGIRALQETGEIESLMIQGYQHF